MDNDENKKQLQSPRKLAVQYLEKRITRQQTLMHVTNSFLKES